jgi:hypothetical protein
MTVVVSILGTRLEMIPHATEGSENLGQATHDATLGDPIHLLPRPGRESRRLLLSTGCAVTVFESMVSCR